MYSSTISLKLFKLYFVVVSIALTFIPFSLNFFICSTVFLYEFPFLYGLFLFYNSSFPSIEVHIDTLFAIKKSIISSVNKVKLETTL